MRARHLIFISVLTAVLGFVPLAPLGATTTFTVNTTVDGVDATIGDGGCVTAGGQCTLRAAVQEANFDAVADTIVLPGGTYGLTIEGDGELLGAAGDLNVTNDLTIQGAGAGVTIIDGAWPSNPDRILRVSNGDTNLTVSSVTIQNGDTDSSGGALNHGSQGMVRLVGVIVRSNRAEYGGMVYLSGQVGGMEIVDSTLTGNEALGGPGEGWGGVMYHAAGGPVTMINVTISGNSATEDAGALFVDEAVEMKLRNVTVTGNVADSDGNGTGDGGGLYHYQSSAVLQDTIVAGNSDLGGEAPDCSGPIVSLGHNLVRDPTGCTGVTGPGDITGQDPRLGPLADNGGPTQTHALLAASPAIDAGGTDCAATDQRGAPRGTCDIGAYEHVKCRGIVVNRVGTEGKDTLLGTGLRDGLLGLGGKDTLKGSLNADGLCGGLGKDTLRGGNGKDRLDGGTGKDTCIGGAGKDKARKCETEKSIP